MSIRDFLVQLPPNQRQHRIVPRVRSRLCDGFIAIEEHVPRIQLPPTNEEIIWKKLTSDNSQVVSFLKKFRQKIKLYACYKTNFDHQHNPNRSFRPHSQQECFNLIRAAFSIQGVVDIYRLPASLSYKCGLSLLTMTAERLLIFSENVRFIFGQHSYNELVRQMHQLDNTLSINQIFSTLISVHMCEILIENHRDPCIQVVSAPTGIPVTVRKINDYVHSRIQIPTGRGFTVWCNTAKFCKTFGVVLTRDGDAVRTFGQIPEAGLDTSHLCDKGNCVQSSHVVYESSSINASRPTCKAKRFQGQECKHTPQCHWKTFKSD